MDGTRLRLGLMLSLQTVHNAIRQCVRVVNHGLLAFQSFQYIINLIHILMLSVVYV